VNRFDIVGLTLAEISLVLLFSFVAIFVPSYARARKELDSVRADKVTTSDVKKQLLNANAENAQLQQETLNCSKSYRTPAGTYAQW
jgi:hypothetical protein